MGHLMKKSSSTYPRRDGRKSHDYSRYYYSRSR